jgi:hypothetical protein
LRLVVLLAIAGVAVTVLGGMASWWMEEDRRLRRLIRKCLGGAPDAAIVARGRNAGAGFRLATHQAVVLWNGGSKALLYPLSALRGAELIVDERVVARVFDGEPRRALDAIDAAAKQVTLRLVFDNPRDPDFELDLFLPEDAHRRDAATPAQAIAEARSWLARSEAILRMPPPAPVVQIDMRRDEPPRINDVEPEEDDRPPWEDDEDDGEPDLFKP